MQRQQKCGSRISKNSVLLNHARNRQRQEEMKMIRKDLQPGDMIKCFDVDDMVKTDRDINQLGYDTEYIYEHDGKKGYWILIIGRYGQG